eukprot:CAMPEP_0177448914 /NCGR_PEP_ID=MMETSP0369-20130122/8443_1 /TAXON_ID=447022 ORGANISM="Scrippsiella hangoei-like, Strain SHHI-4" /NCGR_SAMPLE_ID=MMETSP0369 /ASSEMBLY_ACC=CAM_ASM_000364 /LENGTH=36 /DNA_ID= /DNA_START= /DNA_END= /DNA_ORIENTATION=
MNSGALVQGQMCKTPENYGAKGRNPKGFLFGHEQGG